MPWSARHLPHLLALAILALLLVELLWRLSSFPGLHGDEAWVGLRALEIREKGFFSLHGMTAYTGALFPQVVALAFSVLKPDVLALRLPGVVFNWLALAILFVTFRKRGYTAFYAMLLFASSLLFLFYSRVAWEVSALQNMLLALIVWTVSEILPAGHSRRGHIVLFFLAFALGTWNHFIFLAAALSFAMATTFVALSYPSKENARLFLLGAFNLPVQFAVLIGMPPLSDGAFFSHALPALLAGFALVAVTSIAYIRAETRLLPWIAEFPVRRPGLADPIHNFLVYGTAGAFLIVLPYDGTSFFGTVSGFIMMERVVSYVPSPLEAAGLQIRMAVLVAAFALFVYRQTCPNAGERQDALKRILLLWPIAFLPVVQIATPGLSDRYFIIPQFLFFAAVALSIDDMPFRWRRFLQAVLALGFLYTQFFLWHEIARAENRPPLDYHYGFYNDTSRHFLKLDGLQAYVRGSGFCEADSNSFFIDRPMHFLLAVHPPSCRGPHTVQIEYCDTCREPVPWFSVTSAPQ